MSLWRPFLFKPQNPTGFKGVEDKTQISLSVPTPQSVWAAVAPCVMGEFFLGAKKISKLARKDIFPTTSQPSLGNIVLVAHVSPALNNRESDLAWWHKPLISELRRQRQVDSCEFEDSLISIENSRTTRAKAT